MKPSSLFTLSLITSASLCNVLNAEILRYAQYDKENSSLQERIGDSWQSTNDSAQSSLQDSTNPTHPLTPSARDVEQDSTQNAQTQDSTNAINYTQSQHYNKLTKEDKDKNNLEAKQLEKVSITAQVSQSELPIELQSKQISIVDKNALLEKTTLGGAQSVLENVPGILYSRSGGINGQITFRGQNSTS